MCDLSGEAGNLSLRSLPGWKKFKVESKLYGNPSGRIVGNSILAQPGSSVSRLRQPGTGRHDLRGTGSSPSRSRPISSVSEHRRRPGGAVTAPEKLWTVGFDGPEPSLLSHSPTGQLIC